jgi:hypothetical protein
VDFCKVAKRFAFDHRAIAREDDYRAAPVCELFARSHNRMARASLLRLKNEMQIRESARITLSQPLCVRADSPFDLFCLVANYHVNGFRSQFQGRSYYVSN